MEVVASPAHGTGHAEVRAEAHIVEQPRIPVLDVPVVVAHRAFHFALFEASHRQLVVRVLSQLWDFADLYRSYYMRTRRSESRDHREHESILAAAEARDVGRLVQLMDAHRGGTVESIEASLADGRRL